MGQALRPGGLYYMGETPVDANGITIEGAPSREKDTAPGQQPGSTHAPTEAEKIGLSIGTAVAQALRGQPIGGPAHVVNTVPVEPNPAALAGMPTPLPVGTQVSSGVGGQRGAIPAGSPIPGSSPDEVRAREEETQRVAAEEQARREEQQRKLDEQRVDVGASTEPIFPPTKGKGK